MVRETVRARQVGKRELSGAPAGSYWPGSRRAVPGGPPRCGSPSGGGGGGGTAGGSGGRPGGGGIPRGGGGRKVGGGGEARRKRANDGGDRAGEGRPGETVARPFYRAAAAADRPRRRSPAKSQPRLPRG